MTTGAFAYRKNLEQARKALLDRGDTQYKTPSAKEGLDSQQGLMRPQARPTPEAGGLVSGIGLALMESMGAPVARPDYFDPQAPSPEGTDRPSSRRDATANSFRDRLKRSESSGNSEIQIQLEDGRTMTGAYQFGDARLKDYKKANKVKFTTEAFRKDPELQEEVFQWHMADIDRVIKKLPKAKGLSQDGLRAVAHLGGNEGMMKYVNTGGKHNPADKFGTRLSDYYAKFK